ncbi:MAG: hypothetical protein WDO15_14640 [Bacteroidota bacterium]
MLGFQSKPTEEKNYVQTTGENDEHKGFNKKTPTKSTPKPTTTQQSQQKKEPPKKQLANEPAIDASAGDEKRVRDIISFLEFVLNTLGSESTPARDKETVITESYSKIFRDAKVQIEDDLDANAYCHHQ